MKHVEFEHALVIGGTGMLADATRRIAENATRVTLVARNEGPMKSLVGATPANLVAVDYTDVEAFFEALRTTRETSGDFDLLVAWIHSVGSPALAALAELLEEGSGELRFVHVLGSGGENAQVPELGRLEHVTYQRVLLGHVPDHGGNRWLTNEEISDGVWRAVVSGKTESIVGRLPG